MAIVAVITVLVVETVWANVTIIVITTIVAFVTFVAIITVTAINRCGYCDQHDIFLIFLDLNQASKKKNAL